MIGVSASSVSLWSHWIGVGVVDDVTVVVDVGLGGVMGGSVVDVVDGLVVDVDVDDDVDDDVLVEELEELVEFAVHVKVSDPAVSLQPVWNVGEGMPTRRVGST